MTQTLNDLANQIGAINKEKGFREPIAEEVGINAATLLNVIGLLANSFEEYRRDTSIQFSGNTLDVASQDFAKVKLLLVISEIMEVIEAWDTDKEAEEVADVFIRMLDFVESANIDIDAEIAKKVAKNKQRPYKHGHNF